MAGASVVAVTTFRSNMKIGGSIGVFVSFYTILGIHQIPPPSFLLCSFSFSVDRLKGELTWALQTRLHEFWGDLAKREI
jgi:hypothetical protein